MRRMIETKLVAWKRSDRRKPLLIRGARQVGKSYSIERLGKEHFKQVVVIDFEKHKRAHRIFSGNLDARTMINQLEVVMCYVACPVA